MLSKAETFLTDKVGSLIISGLEDVFIYSLEPLSFQVMARKRLCKLNPMGLQERAFRSFVFRT